MANAFQSLMGIIGASIIIVIIVIILLLPIISKFCKIEFIL